MRSPLRWIPLTLLAPVDAAKWVVHVTGADPKIAVEDVAANLGLRNSGQVGSLPDAFVLLSPEEADEQEIAALLTAHPQIARYERQSYYRRHRRGDMNTYAEPILNESLEEIAREQIQDAPLEPIIIPREMVENTENANSVGVGRLNDMLPRRKSMPKKLENGGKRRVIRPKIMLKEKEVKEVRLGGMQTPNDPLFKSQWYLHSGKGMGISEAWDLGYTGKGVVVSVLDDGLDHTHPDIAPNYDPEASYDINDDEKDPMPRTDSNRTNRHGTRCAGSIAGVANNHVCGVGVSPNAQIGGIRLIDGEITDADEATALGFNPQHVHIYSSSWGPEDDGRTVEGPAVLAQLAMEKGVREGRGGKGSLYVFASGNGRRIDNCNCDGYANSIYTLSIGAVDHTYSQPWYMEPCVAMIAVAFSSGASKAHAITTTDLGGACTNKHTGTSAAAPLAVGVVALALEANPLLTWRDMQHLIVQTANHIHPDDDSWVTNAAGHRVSTRFGFGLLNARSMVENAKNFRTVLPFSATSAPAIHMTEAISEGTGSPAIQRTYVSPHANTVARIEHVTVRATIDHQQRGDLELTLISPGGTSVQLLTARPRDDSTKGFVDWTFSTIHLWGENPIGEWTLVVADTVANGHTGSLVSWQLTIYGAAALKEGESYGANEFRIPLSTVTSENYSWRTLIGNFLFVGSVFSFIFVVRK